MPQYKVSVSIVTHNSGEYIGRLLDSIFANTKGASFKVFVIDNDSRDDTAEIVQKFKNAILIRNAKNIGFGRAHNIALPFADSIYHACVNPDTFITEDVLSGMSGYLDNNEDIGMLSPRILHEDGSLQVLPKRDPKLKYLISRRTGWLLKKYRREYEMLSEGQDKAFDIEFATGCFMFMRTELLRKTGGFDERYFLYFEDADFSRSLRKYARIQYNPLFTVYHRWERKGAKNLKFFLIQIASMFKYFLKWGGKG